MIDSYLKILAHYKILSAFLMLDLFKEQLISFFSCFYASKHPS